MADFLTELRARARADAAPLRENALVVDRDPTAVHDTFDRHPHLRAYMGLPPEYADEPVRVAGTPVYFTTCVEQVVAMEELARADAGGVLGLPGPSMSGYVVAELADAEQRDRYYGMLAARPTWTFFGMTEPGHGSDPAGMGTRIEPDGGGFALTGTKRYVGNGARAGIGVVFARRAPGPLGVEAVLVETDRPGFSAVPIETLGLRGLQLSELRMSEVPIGERDLLGRHLSATRRGMTAATRTFHRFRPVVSAMALGVAQAAYDYLAEHRPAADLAEFAGRLAGTRALILGAARVVDHDQRDGTMASAAKIRATRLAEDITAAAPRHFGPGARWEHPLLDKLIRDARAFEFMEGTGNIQRLTLAQGYLHGRLRDVAPV